MSTVGESLLKNKRYGKALVGGHGEGLDRLDLVRKALLLLIRTSMYSEVISCRIR